NGKKETTPVDAYPGGRSSFGVWDMAGNVWEWTCTPKESSSSQYVAKGGCSLSRGGEVTCFYSESFNADKMYPYLGFRVLSETGG
ncbi:formylglycine-generating enzyme family protein, partial [bacterium]|nr:formylglycine-generating enzyme family protein [bacterium]